MFVKICGVTSEEDALLAVAMDADARTATLVLITLQKLASSSIAAVRSALERRLDRLQQTHPDVPVVVVDNGSHDGTSVQVRRHALDGTGAALLSEFSTAVDLVVVGSHGRTGLDDHRSHRSPPAKAGSGPDARAA